MVALRFNASRSFIDVIGDTIGFDKSTVSRAINNVTNALLLHKDRFIEWQSPAETAESKQNFFLRGGFHGVTGCVDGTHVRIQAPSEDESVFVNRKGWHSINVQAICDYEGKFINIDAQWPGSTHDSHIFRSSEVSTFLETHHRGVKDGYLLGDSGYACSRFLLTPYLNPGNDSEEVYNAAHCRTRNTIERVFGWWKRRFHILQSEIRMKPAKVCKITGACGACAIVQNIALSLREEMEDDDDDQNDNDAVNVAYRGPEDGRTIRNFITRTYF